MKKKYGTDVILITYWWGYQDGSPFATLETDNREAYYTAVSNNTEPFLAVDGVLYETSNADWKKDTTKIFQYIEQRRVLSSPVTVAISTSCPAASGTAAITVENTSNASITGTLQVIVKELGIKYSWATYTVVDCAVRDMIPDEKGEEITVGAGQSVSKTRTFTIDSKWIKDSCRIVAFLQKSDKEIVGAASVTVNQGTSIDAPETKSAKPITFKTIQRSKMLFIPFSGAHTVFISDARGREVTRFLSGNGMQWYRLSEALPAGLNLITVHSKNGIHIEKFLVIK